MSTTIIFEQVATLFLFAAIGFVLAKTNIINKSHSKLLSVLGVYVFMFSKTIKTFAGNFNAQYITENYRIIGISAIVLVLLVILAKLLAKLFSKDQYMRNIVQYTLTISNYGYFGYVLAEALYGEAFLMNLMLFSFPLNIYVNSEGYRLLTGTGKLTLKKLVNPMLISIIIGGVIGYFSIPIPTVVDSVLTSASSCTGPIAMLLMGVVIAEQKILSLLTDIRVYILSLLRLFVIPALICGSLYLLCGKEIATLALMIYAMPCGMNTIVFPKLVGKDCKMGAGLALISTVLCLVTLPFWLSIFK